LPPDDDEVTDEDSDDNEDAVPMDPNHLGRGILSQQAELVMYSEVEELPDVDEVEEPVGVGAEEPQPGPSTPRTPGRGRGQRPSKRPCVVDQEDEDEYGEVAEKEDEDEAGPGDAGKLSRYVN
jgi:hypothetical protein